MKLSYILGKAVIVPAVLLASLSACTDHYEDLNKNPNGIDISEGLTPDMMQDLVSPLLKTSITSMSSYGPSYVGSGLVTANLANLIYGVPKHQTSFYAEARSNRLQTMYWNNAYGTKIRVIQEALALLEQYEYEGVEADKAIFRVNLLNEIIRLADTFGVVPFSELGESLTPKYETQAEIYPAVIAELGELVTTLESVSGASIALSSGDIIYAGDYGMWTKFANSLRLRTAVRWHKVADQSTVIAEIMSKPLMETTEEGASFATVDDESLIWTEIGGMNSSNALTRWGDEGKPTAGILNIMTFADEDMANDDPRLNPLFLKTTVVENAGSGYFNGLISNASQADKFYRNWSVTELESFYADLIANNKEEADAQKIADASAAAEQWATYTGKWNGPRLGEELTDAAYYDDRMFARLNGVPGYGVWTNASRQGILLASEVWFLKAEVYAAGIVAGDAKTAYMNGVKANLDYYGVASNTDFEMALETAFDTADDKVIPIVQQKLVTLTDNGYEAYAEVRRVGFDKLYVAERDYVKMPKNYVDLPGAEAANNAEGYTLAQDKLQDASNFFWD
ncbi:SusD/RagB family nutrient-binding outer membrane lipoprotein [Algivirga pacifica]|uniref:SusD/RagB family nutrient-binding outer membrane lipoprotein n=1 Tax=Algivirga pacifica TaxID=1162670 RepID=A0ABP9D4X7_9BACT